MSGVSTNYCWDKKTSGVFMFVIIIHLGKNKLCDLFFIVNNGHISNVS